MKNTIDEINLYVSNSKQKKMYQNLDIIKQQIKRKNLVKDLKNYFPKKEKEILDLNDDEFNKIN